MARLHFGVESLTVAVVILLSLFFYCGGAAHGASAEEIQQWLDAHNTHRALHGVPDLVWSDTVAASAQAFADSCPSGHENPPYGENLAWATNMRTLQEIVDLWYSEESLYDYNSPGWDPQTGHFTQIVWKNTTEIGCGSATGCPDMLPAVPGTFSNVWVCRYNPPGNVQGQFADNVFPPGTTPGCPDCSGGAVSISNEDFPAGTECECIGTVSITIGNDVNIPADATVTFKAPIVTVGDEFHPESGATIYFKQ